MSNYDLDTSLWRKEKIIFHEFRSTCDHFSCWGNVVSLSLLNASTLGWLSVKKYDFRLMYDHFVCLWRKKDIPIVFHDFRSTYDHFAC